MPASDYGSRSLSLFNCFGPFGSLGAFGSFCAFGSLGAFGSLSGSGSLGPSRSLSASGLKSFQSFPRRDTHRFSPTLFHSLFDVFTR